MTENEKKELAAYAREVRERLYGDGGDDDQLGKWLETASPEDIALLTYVLSRLDDDYNKSNLYDPTMLTVSPEVARLIHERNMYTLAKAAARRGEFEPLLKILTAFAVRQLNLNSDPELADLITGKTQPRRRRKSSFIDPAYNAFWERRECANAVKRIREIIAEKIEKQPSHELVIEIAAAVLECDPKEISKIIHRGKAL
jgi:hypothetical protein